MDFSHNEDPFTLGNLQTGKDGGQTDRDIDRIYGQVREDTLHDDTELLIDHIDSIDEQVISKNLKSQFL